MSKLTPRPGIMDITPYVGGESKLAGFTRVIKLASNEGALGPNPKAAEAYRSVASELHRYPDGSCAAVRNAIGARYGLEPERIVCGAGSDELISLLTRAYAGVGDEVVYSRHGFLMYPIATRTTGATPVAAPETNLTADVDALLSKVTDRTRIVFLANPNNPTGSFLPASEVKRLRETLRQDVLLVIDAAYAEYISRNDYTPGDDLVRACDNVVMLRTFSKIHALGSVRLGWAYGSTQVIDVLNRVRNPFNVSAPAQAAGVAALSDAEFMARSKAHNDVWLPWLTENVRALGLEVPPSVGNFILIRFPNGSGRDADAADAYLRGRGIIARKVGAYGLGDCLRMTVGLEDEMRAVVESLRTFMG
jgi:histidinol-phosphate aminotransferase